MKLFSLALVAFLLTVQPTAAQRKEPKKQNNMTSILEKGTRAPATNFTGTVWVNLVVGATDGLNSTVGKVTFEPKARTHWHSHPKGQVLIVTDGVGYYQERGKPIQTIRPGDVVKIAPNTVHWHGGSHSSAMTHTAIVPEAGEGAAVWMQPVSDDEYNSQRAEGARSAENAPDLTEAAIRNHEMLWPGYISRAKATDPELIEVFDNFAFDDVIAHDSMDVKTRTMMIMASTIGSGALTEFRMMAGAALNVGVPPVEVREVVYQAVPYVGVARTIDFLYAMNEIFSERGIQVPLENQATTNRATRMERGLAKQKEIVGDRVDEMYRSAPADLLHIQHFLSANCFGDYITRDGLSVQMRELVTLSFLIAMGGTESQIKGHVRGNAAVGNNRQTMINLMTQLLPYVGYPRTLNAVACLNEVLPAAKN